MIPYSAFFHCPHQHIHIDILVRLQTFCWNWAMCPIELFSFGWVFKLTFQMRRQHIRTHVKPWGGGRAERRPNLSRTSWVRYVIDEQSPCFQHSHKSITITPCSYASWNDTLGYACQYTTRYWIRKVNGQCRANSCLEYYLRNAD